MLQAQKEKAEQEAAEEYAKMQACAEKLKQSNDAQNTEPRDS